MVMICLQKKGNKSRILISWLSLFLVFLEKGKAAYLPSSGTKWLTNKANSLDEEGSFSLP